VRNMINGFRDLRIYQKSYELSIYMLKLALNFPKEERHVICDQIRRAVLSVPLNIAEGYGKKDSEADFKRYLRMSAGSCNEIEVLIDIVKDLGYIEEKEHARLINEYVELRKQIYSLIKNWKRD